MQPPSWLRLAGVLLILFAAAVPHPAPAATIDGSTIPPVPGIDITPEEKQYAVELYNLINNERKARNLLEFGEHPALWKAAFKYAETMLPPGTPLSHIAPDGSDPDIRAEREGYDVGTFHATAGENLAGGVPTALDCFNAWMASPPHAANILMVLDRNTIPTPFLAHMSIGVAIQEFPNPAGGDPIKRIIVVGMFGIQQFLTDPTTPQQATFNIPANQGGTLTVTAPTFSKARTFTVTVTGSPSVPTSTSSVAANTAKTVSLAIPSSTAARLVTAATTDGDTPPSISFQASTPTPTPTPQRATLNIAANQQGTLTVTAPTFSKARTLTVTVTGSPTVPSSTSSVAANTAKTVNLTISKSTAARVATAMTTDGNAPPTLSFKGSTPTPTPKPQQTLFTIPAAKAGTLKVVAGTFSKARTLTITVTGTPAVSFAPATIAANSSKTVTLTIPKSTTSRTVTARLTDGPPAPVVTFTASVARAPGRSRLDRLAAAGPPLSRWLARDG